MSTESVSGPVGVAEQLLVLLLTDVESSTQHWLREPQRMPAALDVLDVAVEHSMSRFGGEIVRPRGEGDSHFVVFPRPRPRCELRQRCRSRCRKQPGRTAWSFGYGSRFTPERSSDEMLITPALRSITQLVCAPPRMAVRSW